MELQTRIAECLESENDEDAVAILAEHAAAINDDGLVKLVDLALDGEDDNAIAKYYLAVIGRVDADMAARLNTELGSYATVEEICVVLRDDASKPHHAAIIDAMEIESDEMDDDDIGELLAGAGDKLSNELKVRVARAITVDTDQDTSVFIAAISSLGGALDDATLVRVVDLMAAANTEPTGEGGEVGEKP
jgi:hypothetical protein